MQNKHWDDCSTAIRRACSKPDKHTYFTNLAGEVIRNEQHVHHLTPFNLILKEQGLFIKAKSGKVSICKHGKKI